ncbi:PfkB family carbohydrate kinase [Demequina sp. SO4-13]|uniref:PfkB family carbohydrate kinase n=1 Tax=Demequina sp. SO4-13 TaxID=3401027 RepID=UPI003AF6C6FA
MTHTPARPVWPTAGNDLAGRIRRRAPLVTVIGDPMMDGWVTGTSDRLAREAPAPVVRVGAEQRSPGGAANTALNLRALGARVRFVGVAGDDDAGAALRAALEDADIDVSGLILDAGSTTVVKDRVVAGGQILVRLDRGTTQASESMARRVREAAARAIEGADAMVVCDYGGAAMGPVRAGLKRAGARPPLTVVDAHRPESWRALRPDMVTPNLREAAALVPELDREGTDPAEAVSRAAPRLLAAMGARAAVVTLATRGAILIESGRPVHRTFAHAAPEQHASGAGDTFTAALTAARATGVPWVTAMEAAQCAAEVAVSRPGTAICTSAELSARMAGTAALCVTPEELAARLRDERAAGRRIVFTNGCFDVLHPGHARCLQQASAHGDVLVVALNGDESVRRLKGDGRPVNPLADRIGVVGALHYVDYVTSFEGDTPLPMIESLQPDVFVRGTRLDARARIEARAVEGFGGEVVVLDEAPQHSTTAVVERIRSSPAPASEA